MQELSAMTGLVSGIGGKGPNSFSIENGKIFQKLVCRLLMHLIAVKR